MYRADVAAGNHQERNGRDRHTGTGAGVSVTPVAFLVVSGGNVRTVQLVEKVTAVDNAIAALPELVDKITAMIKKDKPAETGNA